MQPTYKINPHISQCPQLTTNHRKSTSYCQTLGNYFSNKHRSFCFASRNWCHWNRWHWKNWRTCKNRLANKCKRPEPKLQLLINFRSSIIINRHRFASSTRCFWRSIFFTPFNLSFWKGHRLLPKCICWSFQYLWHWFWRPCRCIDMAMCNDNIRLSRYLYWPLGAFRFWLSLSFHWMSRRWVFQISFIVIIVVLFRVFWVLKIGLEILWAFVFCKQT